MHGQFLNYRWIGAMAYGERFGGVVLNMVQTGDAFKFERPSLEPAPAMFTRFPRVIEDAERRIAELEDEGRLPGEWPASPAELVCQTRYGECPYANACRWGA